MANRDLQSPQAYGLYDPRFEHDSCGVSFVVDMRGRAGHRIVERAIESLCNLDHRGAKGAEPDTGDGAGILVQLPDRLFRAVVDFDLPPAGRYVSGMAFLDPADPDTAQKAVEVDTGEVVLAREHLAQRRQHFAR